jgi:hypothetical protein
MNFFKLIFCLLLFVFFTSCGAVREGFSNQKKNNSDEFLVEKKSPLIMPPDFDELPIPNNQNNDDKTQETAIKKLISTTDNDAYKSENTVSSSTNLEKSLIEKINNN